MSIALWPAPVFMPMTEEESRGFLAARMSLRSFANGTSLCDDDGIISVVPPEGGRCFLAFMIEAAYGKSRLVQEGVLKGTDGIPVVFHDFESARIEGIDKKCVGVMICHDTFTWNEANDFADRLREAKPEIPCFCVNIDICHGVEAFEAFVSQNFCREI